MRTLTEIIVHCSATMKAIPITIGQIGAPQKLIGSAANGYTFAYAPAIIKVGDTYHKYYCSTGTGATAWDIIRHSTSTDLVVWTTPDQVLVPSDPINERSCCDPSIVKFNAGDGDYYYLYYSGNKVNVQTVNFVARAQSPFGPFAKYTERGTWEVNALDPRVIQYPFTSAAESSNVYGLGQPAVVANGNLLCMWFSDTTENISDWKYLIYMSTSTDGLNWQRPIPTGIESVSIDVKYDTANNRFIMFSGEGHHAATPKMMSRVSDNGVHWSDPSPLFDMPAYSHNIGVSGGERGEIQFDKMLFAYGAPIDLGNNASWAAWDLYGQIHDISKAALPFKKLSTAAASEATAGLPATNVVNNTQATLYSSLAFTTSTPNRPIWLAGWWEDGKSTVTKIALKARLINGAAVCFPKKYTLHATSPDNKTWVALGEFTNQPDASGDAIIEIGQRDCHGVLITPTVLSADPYGNHYFQLCGVGVY